MTDKCLMDRWIRLMKVKPHDRSSSNQNSWSEKSRNLLTTENKIYAIKISDEEHKPISTNFKLTALKKKKRSLVLKKWMEECQWKLPKSMILFSVLQIFFQFLGPLDLAYQTLAFSPIHKLELWRFFTYALLHAGPAHLVINIILQLVISLPLESEVGLMNLVFVYIFGIFSGSLAASISADFSLMVGASSGIYSLLMSHIPHIYMNFSTISHRTHRIIFVTVLSASDVIYAIIHCLENREPQIAVRSHVAGAFSGILMGFIFYESHRIDNGKKDLKFKIIRKTSIATFLCLVMFFILLNVV